MADSIKVNANQWQALSTADQSKISQILKDTGLLRDASITPDPATPASGPAAAGFLPSGVCKALCGVAEGAAVAACAGLAPIAAAACVVAAHAGADLCRSKC
jgi:hypothetical protein